MFPFGGVGAMLAGAVVAGVVALLVHLVLRQRLGPLTAGSIALLLWSVAVIGLLTLVPANGAPGIVSAQGRLDHCSFDVGGPAPDGFWIFSGGQRLLNTLIFIPSGALWVLAVARWPRSLVTAVPLGLVLLTAYSAGIEYTQLELARLDRACDVTDVIDNATGAAVGLGVGLVLAVVLRPWRHRTRTYEHPAQ